MGAFESVVICNCHQYWRGATKSGESSNGLLTVAACLDIAGLSILALRGIIGEGDRESLLSGLHAVVQEGRKNINGNNADIDVCLTLHYVNSVAQIWH